ncbi:calcium-binding EGF domain-containing protein [Phthorimaea operculella]|nr:calcium-binding EGF domain-containing protein [Phthorimaea operculella]
MKAAIVILLMVISYPKICFAEFPQFDVIEEVTTTHELKIVSTSFQIPEDKWTANALKDIAYYLRNYKFNEWDRRYFKERPNKTGFYDAFPLPPLKTLHWRVHEHCSDGFYKCVVYLHSVIGSNKNTPSVWHKENNDEFNSQSDDVCKRGLISSEEGFLPFDDIVEKFQWRTTASYYMCWFTMLELPELSMITESCDNFATCTEPAGFHNHDIRGDDRQSFACAMHSFCPDPCCPMKLLQSKEQCRVQDCPCFTENLDSSDKDCKLYRKHNQNFKDIIVNRFNVSCNCKEKGFEWNSQSGLCIDTDECFTGKHNCDESQVCLNTVGGFVCACKFGSELNASTGKCVQNAKLIPPPTK